MQPRFLYFDLGNVLLKFDNQIACRQISALVGVSPEKVHEVVFASGLQLQYESGAINDEQFHQTFCRQTDTRVDMQRLLLAASEMFTLNMSIVPLVAALDAAGYRLGILSNTCAAHWRYCTTGRYGLINRAFSVHALSYELGACKPDAKIFEGAARLAGFEPSEIFFVDDILRHVEAARRVGFDAVQYTSTAALADELRRRGLQFNY